MVVVSEWKAEGKREGGGGGLGNTVEREGKEGGISEHYVRSNRSSMARSVDGRVVGPLGQVASHIASHMVYISPHCLCPSSNWQVMYRCSSPPSLLFFSFINGRHSGVVVMVVEVIVALGLALCHTEAQR